MNAVHMVLHLLLSLEPLHAFFSLTLKLEFIVHLIDVITDFLRRRETCEAYLTGLDVTLDAALVSEVRTTKFMVAK